MKKILILKHSTYIFVILFLLFAKVNGQCPLPPGLTLTTQAQVNAFPATYPGCTVIPDGADISIKGAGITDLSPLSQLTSVLGVLEVRDCTGLTSLNGLHNITSLGNDPLDGFILRNLTALTSISALNNLLSITGEFTIRNCAGLTTLTGLNNLTAVNGNLIIRDNTMLQNFNGLNSLSYIGEALEIVGNTSLTDISALSNVNTIVGGAANGVLISGNTALTNLTGLGNPITTIGGNLDILGNSNLSICGVPSICHYLFTPPPAAIITINTNAIGCASKPEVTSACVALPIQLVAFEGKSKGDHNHMYWETAGEFNSSHFEIERSFDGSKFTRIGKLNSSGYSSSRLYYEFYDHNPISGIHYYRLKHFDVDGNYQYSKIIVIENSARAEIISIYPNPVANELFFITQKTDLKYEIVNTAGQILLTGIIITEDPVQVASLQKGLYFYRIILPDSRPPVTGKFIKL